MKWLYNLCALAVISGAPAIAQATTIDFDAQATGTYTSITEQGFDFTYVGFGDPQEVRDLGGGNKALFDSNINNPSGAAVVVSRTGGGAFDLISFDIINLGSGSPGAFGIVVAGTRYTPALGTTNVVVNLLGISSFGINIASRLAAGLNTNDWGIDNITVETATVPEPSTFAVLGLGLAGLGLARRRKAT